MSSTKNNKKKSYSANRRHQKGGGSTDYAQLFYAPYADPAQLSRFTLQYIDKAPMFNPLETNTIIPTGTSGIIPTGAYYDAVAPLTIQNSIGPPVAQYAQLGGSDVLYVTQKGKKITNSWIAHVFKYAEKNNVSYSQALKAPDVKKSYIKKSRQIVTAGGKSQNKTQNRSDKQKNRKRTE
jgi:hypothetical protein